MPTGEIFIEDRFTKSSLTIGVPDVHLGDTTALGIDVIGPVQHGDGSLDEAHATGKVEGSVPLSVTHQRVGISLEKVLDDLVLTSQHCQVQGRLREGEDREREEGKTGKEREREGGEREREGGRERGGREGRESEQVNGKNHLFTHPSIL